MKKNLIIIAVVIVIAAMLLYGWNFVQKNRQNNSQKDTSQQAQTTFIPPLDTTIESMKLQDPKNLQQIRESVTALENRISFKKTNDNKEFAEFTYTGTDGQPVELNDFSKAINITILSDLLKNIDQKKFSTIYCLNNSQKEYGLILNVKHPVPGESIDFANVKSSMKEWEKTMLRNLQSLIFPNIDFADAGLNQTLKFSDGKYRFSVVILQIILRVR